MTCTKIAPSGITTYKYVQITYPYNNPRELGMFEMHKHNVLPRLMTFVFAKTQHEHSINTRSPVFLLLLPAWLTSRRALNLCMPIYFQVPGDLCCISPGAFAQHLVKGNYNPSLVHSVLCLLRVSSKDHHFDMSHVFLDRRPPTKTMDHLAIGQNHPHTLVIKHGNGTSSMNGGF